MRKLMYTVHVSALLWKYLFAKSILLWLSKRKVKTQHSIFVSLFSYASSSTLYSGQWVSRWAEFRTSVAWSLRACFNFWSPPNSSKTAFGLKQKESRSERLFNGATSTCSLGCFSTELKMDTVLLLLHIICWNNITSTKLWISKDCYQHKIEILTLTTMRAALLIFKILQ